MHKCVLKVNINCDKSNNKIKKSFMNISVITLNIVIYLYIVIII